MLIHAHPQVHHAVCLLNRQKMDPLLRLMIMISKTQHSRLLTSHLPSRLPVRVKDALLKHAQLQELHAAKLSLQLLHHRINHLLLKSQMLEITHSRSHLHHNATLIHAHLLQLHAASYQVK